jgi:transcriptional regulator with XRE-family HTH domain
MQALRLTLEKPSYNQWMISVGGRPAKRARTAFGERLYQVRIAAGLSQQQVAAKIGLSQRAFAYWERHPVALRPEQIEQLAVALNIAVSDLIGEKEERKRGTGPTGKMKQLFEQASELPRHHQQKISAVLEAFIAQHTAEQRSHNEQRTAKV